MKESIFRSYSIGKIKDNDVLIHWSWIFLFLMTIVLDFHLIPYLCVFLSCLLIYSFVRCLIPNPAFVTTIFPVAVVEIHDRNSFKGDIFSIVARLFVFTLLEMTVPDNTLWNLLNRGFFCISLIPCMPFALGQILERFSVKAAKIFEILIWTLLSFECIYSADMLVIAVVLMISVVMTHSEDLRF